MKDEKIRKLASKCADAVRDIVINEDVSIYEMDSIIDFLFNLFFAQALANMPDETSKKFYIDYREEKLGCLIKQTIQAVKEYKIFGEKK
jgi:septin family protein